MVVLMLGYFLITGGTDCNITADKGHGQYISVHSSISYTAYS